MSLSLELGTLPAGLEVRTHGFGSMVNTVSVGEYEISMEDFLIATEYALTNTDLEPNDPRLQFVKCVKSMVEIGGYSQGRKRLKASKKPVLSSQS